MSAYNRKSKRRLDKEEVSDKSKKTKSSDDYSHLYKYFGPLQIKKDDDSDTSPDDESNYLSGNDDFEFNNALLHGGSYYENNETSSDESSRFIDVEKLDSFHVKNSNKGRNNIER